MTVGPIQMVVIGFEGDVLESRVLDELEVAVATGDIRLIDFLVIEKDEEDNSYFNIFGVCCSLLWPFSCRRSRYESTC